MLKELWVTNQEYLLKGISPIRVTHNPHQKTWIFHYYFAYQIIKLKNKNWKNKINETNHQMTHSWNKNLHHVGWKQQTLIKKKLITEVGNITFFCFPPPDFAGLEGGGTLSLFSACKSNPKTLRKIIRFGLETQITKNHKKKNNPKQLENNRVTSRCQSLHQEEVGWNWIQYSDRCKSKRRRPWQRFGVNNQVLNFLDWKKGNELNIGVKKNSKTKSEKERERNRKKRTISLP